MRPIEARHWYRGAWLGPALAVLLVTLPAAGADRRVLCEEFTATD